MTCDHNFSKNYFDCEYPHCNKCDCCQTINNCTHIKKINQNFVDKCILNQERKHVGIIDPIISLDRINRLLYMKEYRKEQQKMKFEEYVALKMYYELREKILLGEE